MRRPNASLRPTLGRRSPRSPAHPAFWGVLRRYLEEQIAVGVYPVGIWLPSVRELAAQLGVNRNTVSKVYAALSREGVLEAVPGKGVRVRAARAALRTPELRVEEAIEVAMRSARSAGLTREWVLDRIHDAAGRAYGGGNPSVALVECHEEGTRILSDDLSGHLGFGVTPLLLHDLERSPMDYGTRIEVIATTLFHLQEVSALVAGSRAKVVGINHVVSYQSILEIAQLKPNLAIAVVGPNRRTLEKVERIVKTYTRGRIIPCTLEEPETVERLLAEAEVAIDTVSTHEAVRQLRPELRTITARFHIEEQSILHLRSLLGLAHAPAILSVAP